MKYLFTFILLFHGIIHLLGFVKSFFQMEVNKQVLGIPKPIGALWLIVFIMFVLSSSLFLTNKKWFYIAIIAVCISQILIILSWNDAKFGTLINIIILLVAISSFSNYQFNKMVEKESKILIQNFNSKSRNLSKNEIINLPEIIQKWLHNSGIIGKEKIFSVRLKQTGKLKTKPNGKWMPFKAVQYINVENPSFIWSTNVEVMPLISLVGRDILYNGHAEMLIKLASVIPIVKEVDNEKINSGAMLRFLAEMCWFPSASINEYITWETIDSTSAKATLKASNKNVSGVFKFNNTGDMISFEGYRFYGGKENSNLEKWVISVEDYKTFNGVKIPFKCHVNWKLNEGDFHWLKLEITDLDYNINQPYFK